MSDTIYKKGQGYWTRLMSAIGLGLLVFMGAVWVWDQFKGVEITGVEPIYVSAGAAVLFIAFFAILGYWLIGRKRSVVDFMVATEGEMKRVNWSTRREIVGSTWVIIALTIVVAVLCFLFDAVFAFIFQRVGVLEIGA
ncbi:MAG: preprotein translocase subunit SecE [Planctomycetota bacterium]